MADDVYGLSKTDHDELAQLLRQWRRNGKRLTSKELRNLYHQVIPPVLFRNDSSEEVPAYGVMRVTGEVTIGEIAYITVTKPDSTFSWEYAVNSGTPIQPNEYGTAQQGDYRTFLYDDSDSTPTNGEWFGPVPSQWSMRRLYPSIARVAGTIDTEATTMRCKTPTDCMIERVFGYTQGPIAKDATNGIIEVFSGAPTSGASIITGMTIAGVHNPWDDVADNTWVGASVRNGKATLDAREC